MCYGAISRPDIGHVAQSSAIFSRVEEKKMSTSEMKDIITIITIITHMARPSGRGSLYRGVIFPAVR